ncbi:MAG: hypothetical protein M5U28_02070 [Sandaracinaceae bacterium]|nr:hypothetical protein [Sandaracinaceae bacterium]
MITLFRLLMQRIAENDEATRGRARQSSSCGCRDRHLHLLGQEWTTWSD